MNKFIEKELDKCKIANIPEYDKDTTHLIITKKIPISLESNKYYLIELENYIIHPSDNFTLSTNWNKGIIPKSKYIVGTPINKIGKMICFDCCCYDIDNQCFITEEKYNELWLPEKGFTILKEWGTN